MISLTEDNKMLGYESLHSYPNIFHFVTTRHGGGSIGNYKSFNCSPFSGDRTEDVILNQELLFENSSFSRSCLVIPHQTHGCEIAFIDEAFVRKNELEQQQLLEGIDALITNLPDYCLAVSTADCVPILLYDKKQKVVAAIHAGCHAPCTRPSTGISSSSNSIVTLKSSQISTSVVANPPRVASRMIFMWMPASCKAWIKSYKEAQSLCTSFINPYSPRAVKMAIPWSPIFPFTNTASPCSNV